MIPAIVPVERVCPWEEVVQTPPALAIKKPVGRGTHMVQVVIVLPVPIGLRCGDRAEKGRGHHEEFDAHAATASKCLVYF